MGFVKTKTEIAKIQESLNKPRFMNSEMLSIDFLTHRATVEKLLPPGLEPTETSRVTVMVGRWQSNCVGDFDGGAVYIEARYKDIVGDYVLAMYMDRDQPIIYGRELFGEPKKQCTTRLHRRGDRMNGFVERYGTRLIDLEVELKVDHGPTEGEGVNFNYKAIPSTNGLGLEWDAALTIARFETIVRVNAEGIGDLRLGSTIHDPLDELEIVEPIRGAFIEADLIASAETLEYVDADEFLPYALGRTDDWSALDTETRRAVPAARRNVTEKG